LVQAAHFCIEKKTTTGSKQSANRPPTQSRYKSLTDAEAKNAFVTGVYRHFCKSTFYWRLAGDSERPD
jgi:hypothetical protein